MYLAKNKLDCIEILISNSIKDGITSHDEFLEILKEKKEYNGLKRMKTKLRMFKKAFDFLSKIIINIVCKNYYILYVKRHRK